MKHSILNLFTRLKGIAVGIGKLKLTPVVIMLMVFSCDSPEVTPGNEAVFRSFTTNGQTLPSSINASNKVVKLEVAHDVDVTRL
ncbi:MAG: hypothetical protein WEB30_16935, partial [Cyclobacteriaceae bacterium]